MTTENAGVPDGRTMPLAGVTTRTDTPTLAPVRPRARPAASARRGAPRANRLPALLALLDASAATGAAAALGGSLALTALAPALAVALTLHAHSGLYRPAIRPSALDEAPRLLWHCLIAWCVATAAVSAFRPAGNPAWTVLLAIVAAHAAAACAGRGAVHLAVRRLRSRRPRPALVVGGATTGGSRITASLLDHPEYGMRPVGFVALGTGPLPADPVVPVLRSDPDITRAVIQNTVQDAVFVRSPWDDVRTAALAELFTERGCTLWLITPGPESPARGDRGAEGPAHVWGFACRRIDLPVPGRLGLLGKRLLDLTVACVVLLTVWPLLLACALLVRSADGPGVLFRQERIGRAGRPFTLLKFRTLRPADDHEAATRWSVAGDHRLSAVGSLLRRTSLDELPQLWNVLRGDMSLVGPRPERPYFVSQFSQMHPGYAARHRMPAGVTGLAQVHGLRGNTSIEDRARFDNHYIETWSFWQDLRILLRTAGSLFGGS